MIASSLVGPVALADGDDWEAPNGIQAMDDWEAPNGFKAMDDWEAPIGFKAMDDWEAPNGFTEQGTRAFPFVVFSMDDWESPVAIAPVSGQVAGGRQFQSGCLKVAAMQWQPLAASAAVPVQGFVNVCGTERWQSAEVIDAAWMDTYVRVKDGTAASRAHVYQDAAGWHGLLYNFRTGRWDEKAFAAR
ncbi:MAG TPA: hypothetical protein VF815_23195 [Myxococcaceae bacterium]